MKLTEVLVFIWALAITIFCGLGVIQTKKIENYIIDIVCDDANDPHASQRDIYFCNRAIRDFK